MSHQFQPLPLSLPSAVARRPVTEVDLPRVPARILGRTRRVASALGLGLAGLGRPMYMSLGRGELFGRDRSVTAIRQRCRSLLDTAYAAGIRYFDTARSYG